MNQRSHQIEILFQQGRRLHDAGQLVAAEGVFRQILDVLAFSSAVAGSV